MRGRGDGRRQRQIDVEREIQRVGRVRRGFRRPQGQRGVQMIGQGAVDVQRGVQVWKREGAARQQRFHVGGVADFQARV